MISYIVTPGGISAVINGQQYTVAKDTPTYVGLKEAIKAGAPEAEIESLFSAAQAVRNYAQGAFKVENGIVSYNDEEIHNVVVDRILGFIEEGLPHEPLVKFLDRLLQNPSRRSVEELYTFLEHENLPITEDGHFLAYKGVRDDYSDMHTGTFTNSPGAIHQMERRKVDDDFRVGCSYGFHVGSLAYATGFGPRCVIVKVDPAEVVSVPEDSEHQKLRTARYEVLCDYAGPLPRPLHSDTPYEDEEDEWADDPDPANCEHPNEEGSFCSNCGAAL